MFNLIIKLLIKAIDILAEKDSTIKNEVKNFEQGYCIQFCDITKKYNQVFCFEDGGCVLCTKKFKEEKIVPDMTIELKSKRAFRKLLLGQISCKGAFNAHQIVLYGNIFKAMGLIRIIDIVEQYIFPKFMTKKLFDVKAKIEYNKFKFFMKLLFPKQNKFKR